MITWLKRLKHGPARHISWRVFFEASRRSANDYTPDTPLYYKVEEIETSIFLAVWIIAYIIFIYWLLF